MRIGKRGICHLKCKAVLDAYCQGVNQAVRATGTPFEFKMMGYRPDDWTPADALLMVKLIGFVGLFPNAGRYGKVDCSVDSKGRGYRAVKGAFSCDSR